jgi:hypothetical protein
MHCIPKCDVNTLTEAVHEVIPNAPPYFLASNKARSEILLVQIWSSMCLCMNLSKIRSAAWSHQLPHVFWAYFAPILRISLVVNSRWTYALSHLSLTTDCILATQLRQHRVLQGVATSSKNVSYYKHCGLVKSLQILWPKHASEQLCMCKWLADAALPWSTKQGTILTRLSLSARHLTTNGRRWSSTTDGSLFLSSWQSMAMCGSWAISSARTGASVTHHHSYWRTGQN